MAGILCIVGFLLAGRLGWIQIARGSQYEEMAMNQTEGVQTLYSVSYTHLTLPTN